MATHSTGDVGGDAADRRVRAQRDLATLLAAGGTTVLTVVLVAAMVTGWVVLVVIYAVFFRNRGQ